MNWRESILREVFGRFKGLKEQKVAEVHSYLADKKPFFCRITDAFNGTCRFFACVFTFFGIWLAFKGKLTMEYCTLVGSIQALLVAHSMGQDYHSRNADDPSAPATKP